MTLTWIVHAKEHPIGPGHCSVVEVVTGAKASCRVPRSGDGVTPSLASIHFSNDEKQEEKHDQRWFQHFRCVCLRYSTSMAQLKVSYEGFTRLSYHHNVDWRQCRWQQPTLIVVSIHRVGKVHYPKSLDGIKIAVIDGYVAYDFYKGNYCLELGAKSLGSVPSSIWEITRNPRSFCIISYLIVVHNKAFQIRTT